MTDTTATPSLKPAEQNPWYLLATLYGVPKRYDFELQAKNRVAWNRYYASGWTNADRERLKGRVDAAELKPFDEGELEGIRQQFVQRAATDQNEIPANDSRIDFSECHFDQSVDFGFYLFREVNFSSTTFAEDAFFLSAIFSGLADFTSATFSEDINFSGAVFGGVTFYGPAHFSGTTFSGDAYFSNASFSENAHFRGATFSREAIFRGTTFSGHADFSSANLSVQAIFRGITFSGDTFFKGANFFQNADFTSSTFSGSADFSRAKFHRDAIFINTEFKAPTNFENSHFLRSPPQLHGAKLHEGTVWRDVSWPPVPADPTELRQFIAAYERHKLEMDRLKKHEDELMFFAEELKCRRVERGQLGGWPIGAYGVLCNYGQSYMWPLGWLLAMILVGAVQFCPALKGDFLLSLALSTANTLAALGLRKELISTETLSKLPHWLRFLSGVQMVIGPILLFLIGLGLRNRFRMK